METSLQAWKYAKGLYLVPLFFVFNDRIILGGSLPAVLWDGLLAVFALAAVAAVLEGYLLRPLSFLRRVALVPGIVALYWPDVGVELAGMFWVLGVLFLRSNPDG